MSIWIDPARCVGCGACVDVCPGNLLYMGRDAHAYSREPKDCWGCTACLKECPASAILYFLGADIGGAGTTLSVQTTPTTNDWCFTSPEGTKRHIVIDRTASNKY